MLPTLKDDEECHSPGCFDKQTMHNVQYAGIFTMKVFNAHWPLKISTKTTVLFKFSPFQDIPPYVETLILDRNNIASLSNSVLSHYERLKSLYNQDNHISIIAPGTFIALTQLNDLDLSKNRISKLTRNTFSGLKMIQVVWLC